MSLLDNSVAALQSAMTNINATASDWSENWEAAKNNLINKAAEFSRLYNELQRRGASALANPSLAADYQSIMDKGAYIKSSVTAITSTFDSASDWFNNTLASLKNAVGLGAVPMALNYHAIARRAGMGILPIASVGVILACITAISYWLTSAYELKRKMDFIEQSKAGGTGDKGVQDLVNSLFGGGGTGENILAGAKGIAILAGAGALLYFMWPYIKKGMKK